MLKRKIEVLVAVSLLAVGLLEFASRFWLGLGDPPISIPDSEIDYIFAPNQNCSRFGNTILYNNLSMRCGFSVSENETTNRVFVVGDSVVNGGVFTDHADLATTLLQEAFPGVQVCNVSAGSWGPGNYTAYFRKHLNLIGSNDVLFVEVNSHDLWEDDPARTAGANVGRDVSLPDRKPLFAFSEGFSRYFVPWIRRQLGFAVINTKVDVPKWGSDAENDGANWNLKELTWLFSRQFRDKALIIHRSREESRRSNEQSIGERRFVKWAIESGIRYVILELDSEIHYRDGIHLNEAGQYKLFEMLKKELCS